MWCVFVVTLVVFWFCSICPFYLCCLCLSVCVYVCLVLCGGKGTGLVCYSHMSLVGCCSPRTPIPFSLISFVVVFIFFSLSLCVCLHPHMYVCLLVSHDVTVICCGLTLLMTPLRAPLTLHPTLCAVHRISSGTFYRQTDR